MTGSELHLALLVLVHDPLPELRQIDVLGQVHAGDTIQLLAKTKNGAWYYARCRCGALGWVHASLLKVDPKVAWKVPVA